ncbi:UNVERIFIED_CONTAM: hypothetical protein K2H54_049096 [Gekko kuhli]
MDTQEEDGGREGEVKVEGKKGEVLLYPLEIGQDGKRDEREAGLVNLRTPILSPPRLSAPTVMILPSPSGSQQTPQALPPNLSHELNLGATMEIHDTPPQLTPTEEDDSIEIEYLQELTPPGLLDVGPQLNTPLSGGDELICVSPTVTPLYSLPPPENPPSGCQVLPSEDLPVGLLKDSMTSGHGLVGYHLGAHAHVTWPAQGPLHR